MILVQSSQNQTGLYPQLRFIGGFSTLASMASHSVVTVVLFYSFFGKDSLDLLEQLAEFSHWDIPSLGNLKIFFFWLGPSTQIQDWEIFQGTDAFSDRPFPSSGPGERGIVQSGGLFVRWKPQGSRGRIPWGGSLRVSIVTVCRRCCSEQL